MALMRQLKLLCFLLVFLSYKICRLTMERRYLYFCAAFFALMLSFLFKVIGNFGVYTPTAVNTAPGQFLKYTFTMLSITKINALGFLFYMFFMILGFMGLFLIVSKLSWNNKRVLFVFGYFVLIATWLSGIHYQFFSIL